MQSLKFAARQLRRNPAFAGTVVITLALSIGANTAIFSIVDALLLKDLPYAQPERIGALFARTTGGESSDIRKNVDGEQWELLRDQVPSLLPAVSNLRANGVYLQSGSHVQYLQAARISEHYLDVLGVRPVVGRNFSDDEDRPHGPKAAIISYTVWRNTFGTDTNIVGSSVLLKGEPYTIIGVLPDRAVTPMNADIYTALQPSREGEGVATNFEAIVRLRDAANWAQAGAEIDRAFRQSVRVRRFQQSNPGAQLTYYLVPLQKGVTTKLRPRALVLLLAAGFILLIACANLAGLTLVRMIRRSREIATRLALGASRWQILRQLWSESLLLALLGGAAGTLVGALALRGLLTLLPTHFLPVASIPLDLRVLAFTLGVSIMASVLFGMLPALTANRVDLRSAMGGRGIAGGSVRLRQSLIAGEVALTVVLLAAAGLLIRTLIHLETMPPGFNPAGVITAKASLDDVRYHDPAAFRKLLDRSLTAMREIPGVRSAAVGLTVPYERALLNSVKLTDSKQAGREPTTNQIYVTPGYFDTLQIPILAGRAISDADGPGTEPVVVINRSFARKFYPGENALGRHLDRMRIVGIAGDTALSSASGLNAGSAPLTSEEAIYVPAAQITDAPFLALAHTFFQPSWIVRAESPQGFIGRMQRALAATDPNLLFSGFYSMNDLRASTLATQRIEVALLTAMASLALLLSGIGIFMLVANLVAQRTREIGIRIALGSTVSTAMVHVSGSGAGAAAFGLVLGLALCIGALRALRSAIYGVGVYDATTIVAVVLGLAVVTLIATAVPALRIARIDPASALREE
jgi:macrolide transport system ATP-binding/permease protein